MPEHPNDFLDAALAYAARGWAVFPLKPGGKAPLTAHGFKDATIDIERIRAWWSEYPTANIGLRTGPAPAGSGIVVLDIDRHGTNDGEASLQELQKEFGQLPSTYEVVTPNDGRHVYFVCSNGEIKSRNNLRPGIDLKAEGGYVVAPPSVLEGANRPYIRRNNDPVSPLPSWLLDQANGGTPKSSSLPAPRRSTNMKDSRYAVTALKLELHNLRTATEGTRNDTLNCAAFNLGQLIAAGHLDRNHVVSELASTAAVIGLSERETKATIQSGIEAGMKTPRTIQPKSARRLLSASDTIAPTDIILIPGPHKDDLERYVEQSSKDFADQVIQALPVNRIYRKSHIPGELLGQPGKRRWFELTADRARLIIDEHVKLGAWYQRKNSEGAVLVYKPCNKDYASLVIAGAQQDAHIRDLDLLVHYPVYGPGFTRVQPGWHNGIYYDEPAELKGIEPERDIRQIQDEMHDLLVDFPFKDEASRQNFIGLMLTPLVAPAIDGNRPLHLLLSPLERTGKTKLAEEVLGGVILGRETPALQITNRDEERDKRLLALLLQGETIVHLDNLPPIVDSGALASILTATTYQGRILGASKIINMPNTLTVVGSGNNTECSAEIAKRTVPILLQPRTPHPEARKHFLHPDLRSYVKRNRRRILSVLLGMIENWLDQGRKPHPNRFGGFETWSETIGGILHTNCFNCWRTNEDEWRQSADPIGQDWETFVAAWWERHGKNLVTITELMEISEECECFQQILNRRSERGRRVAFGTLLRRRVDMPVGEVVIRRHGFGTHSAYFLERQQHGTP